MKKYIKIEISQNDFNCCFGEPGDACSCCKNMPWSTIDIDVSNNKVRGLLCRKCKDLLMWAKDDAAILTRAYDYCNQNLI